MKTWWIVGATLGGDADICVVDGHLAPAEDFLALRENRPLDQCGKLRPLVRLVGHEAHPDAIAPARGQLEVDDGAQERVGDLDEDAGAVAGLLVSARGAAMLEVLERLERERDDVVIRLVAQPSDDADAASVVLVARVVEADGPGCWVVLVIYQSRHSPAPRGQTGT